MHVPESIRCVIILLTIYISGYETATVHNLIEEDVSSYSNCKQLSSTSLDCSNLMLKAVPNNIPNTVITLNLSYNQLQLDESSFSSCCSNLLELDLSNNEITSISQDVFKNLVNITFINLRNNSIGEFDSETFSSLKKLEKLDLSKNPLILQKGFINSSKLTYLNLDDCSLSEIPEDTFSGIKQLEALTLTKNPFDEEFDSSAFEDLSSLTKLEIKNISRRSIIDLCEKLTSIDTINLDGYNFSCFIYTAEENFEDAIVGNDPPIEQPLTIPRATRPTKVSSTISVTTTIETSSLSLENSNVSKIIIKDQENKQSEIIATTDVVDHATVDIDNGFIKYILVGILAITLTGILVGLLCRADVFGIKTKMCRSKKASNNRRAPEDTVSPFEEIPLNTVTINSNGKTVEGQG